jgi:hypothetical protein
MPAHLADDRPQPRGSSAAAQLLRQAVFKMKTRRFGALAEILVQKMTGTKAPGSIFYDLYDEASKKRLEVKFSTVLRAHTTKVRFETLEQVLRESLDEDRAIHFSDWAQESWACNIQQVKPSEFDVLVYGLFFADKVVLFKCEAEDVLAIEGYCEKQHKGNVGEGQFTVSSKTLAWHLKNALYKTLSYEDLAAILLPDMQDEASGPAVCDQEFAGVA